MTDLILCDQRKALLTEGGHLLIKGGPGSGKTTISLVKAAKIISEGHLKQGQKVLFLSFARATISRVSEDAKKIFHIHDRNSLEINTYHGFCWNLIQSYGSLVHNHRPIRLLSPPEAATRFYKLSKDLEKEESKRLLRDEGILCFDLFAEFAVEILSKSERIKKIYSDCYPFIFVDEFQDTNKDEWELIKNMGQASTVVALADPHQRIYDFRGANPERIVEFTSQFKPTEFDFKNENNRSSGTDIAVYGNDLLSGNNKGKLYKNVKIDRYGFYAQPMAPLKYALLAGINRLNKETSNKPWSIAVLVRSKKLTLSISNYLSKSTPGLPSIFHEVLIDPSGPALSAVIIAGLMEPFVENYSREEFLKNFLSYLRGRKDKLSQTDLEWSNALNIYLETRVINGSKRTLFLKEVDNLLDEKKKLVFTGIPENDWLTVRKLIGSCSHPSLVDVFEDSKYLRLLNKGALLSSRLGETWRASQNYAGAKNSIKDALKQEHFSMSTRKWQGVFIMTLHKSKGKEFDEVVIWEDQYNSIVSYNAKLADIEQSKLLLRVGVTRARKMTTICTPKKSPCVLI